MKKSFVIMSFLLVSTVATAQGVWNFQQCISHALEHNITLKQRENVCRQQELNLSSARNSRLPDLNGGVSEGFSFGRSLTSQNTYTNTNTNSTGFQLSTSVPLLTGNRIPNTIKLNQLNLEASSADLEKARNDIKVQIAQQYIQIVYDMEILQVANRQVSIDSMQCVRLEEFVKNGKASIAELSQHKASLAQSRLTATQAHNSLQLALLTLTQLLELPSPEGFSVIPPKATYSDKAVPSADVIYADAVTFKPEIQAEQLRLKASDKSLLIAKSALYPTLSLSGGLGTNYYNTSGYMQDGFGKQLKNNFSQSIGISLNVPIFNRMQTRNSIRSAQIDRQNQELTLDNAKKSLYKEIQQVYYNTIAAESKYKSSLQAEKSSNDAFELTKAKYENGKATMTEFNESKNQLMKAQSDMAQARYELVYQQALIEFYQKGTISM